MLITGAAGLLGRCLWKAWEKTGSYELTLTDIRPIADSRSRTEVGDLLDHEFVSDICQNQDTVVALAYIPFEDSSKPECRDIAMNMRLFEASRRAAVQRIVYASSNHATGWNEQTFEKPFVSNPNEQNPTGWYGAMKGMAEIAGKTLVNVAGMRFIGLRIGFFSGLPTPDSLRACEALLAPDDAVQLFRLAIDYDGPEHHLITYGTSETGNTSNLDISPARQVLGYRPTVDLVAYFGAKLPPISVQSYH